MSDGFSDELEEARRRRLEAWGPVRKKARPSPPPRMHSFDYRMLDGKLVRREYWINGAQTLLIDVPCSNKIRVVIDGATQEATLIIS